jgi:hypothetical protein
MAHRDARDAFRQAFAGFGPAKVAVRCAIAARISVRCSTASGGVRSSERDTWSHPIDTMLGNPLIAHRPKLVNPDATFYQHDRRQGDNRYEHRHRR